MSVLVSITATGTATFATPGLRMGTFFLTAGSGAGAAATVNNGATQVIALAAVQGSTQSVNLTDDDEGAIFSGQPQLILTGAGASFNYESM